MDRFDENAVRPGMAKGSYKRCGLLECRDLPDYCLELRNDAGVIATMFVCLPHVPGGIGALEDIGKRLNLEARVYQTALFEF